MDWIPSQNIKWNFFFNDVARKDFSKLDRPIQLRFRTQIIKLMQSNDPTIGSDVKALTGPLKGLYRYRVGDYRMICKIKKKEIIIEAIRIAHRRKSYDHKLQ